MLYERIAGIFLSFLNENDSAPYRDIIETAISDTESRIKDECLEEIPDCINMYAASAALLMYTNALCASSNTVCDGNGKSLANRDTTHLRKAASDYADYCLSLCRPYLKDDKFVMISTKRSGE